MGITLYNNGVFVGEEDVPEWVILFFLQFNQGRHMEDRVNSKHDVRKQQHI